MYVANNAKARATVSRQVPASCQAEAQAAEDHERNVISS